MLGAIVRWLRRRYETEKRIDGIESRLKYQVRLLEEEVKLRDLQIRTLVAENQRNFERIKAETATHSAEVVKATSVRTPT